MKKNIFIIGLALSTLASATPLENYLKSLKKEVKAENPTFKDFSVARGKEIFFSKHIGKKGKEVSCVSCHTTNIRDIGENLFTGKTIKALSPAVNPKRLSNLKKMKKWLRRNFKDVYKREGTPLEKGDVLVFIQSQ